MLKRNQPIQVIDLGKEVLAEDYSETVFLIGRSKDCHIVLDDVQVSREHVRIIHKNGKWSAEKRADDGICLYNGESFKTVNLKNGDSLVVGSFNINIENHEISEDGNPEKYQGNHQLKYQDNVRDQYVNNIQDDDSIEFSSILEDVPEIKPVEVEQKLAKPIPVSAELSQNTPEEIDTSDLTGEIDFGAIVESEVESTNQPNSNNNEGFDLDVDNEMDAELALGVNSEQDENASYSLENIDNEDSSSDNESTKVIQSFSKVQLELFGDTAPYDKYLIENEKTYIGRDPNKCQIVLNDKDVSSQHALITKNFTTITLQDLNSSNGTILNGDRINKAVLNHNDEFVIGGVSFKLKVRSDFLKEENSTLMPVDENQTVDIEEFVDVEAEEGDNFDALGEMISEGPQEKSIIKRIWKDEEKRKKTIYLAVVLVGAWVMFGEDESTLPPTTTKKTKASAVKSEPLVNKSTGKTLSDEEKRALSARYEIGKNHYFNGRYREGLDEFQKISAVDPNFNTTLQSFITLSKEGLGKIEEQEKKRLAEQTSAEKKIKIKELVAKAEIYVKDRRVELAQEIFNEIAKIDPENIEITKMKFELEDWQREKARKDLEELTKKLAREDKVEKLRPAKALFIQKEWFKAIGKLDDYLKIKDMDDDLTKEASEMLKTSRDEIALAVGPLVGKAKSLMEGQDLKGAYEVYMQILKFEPSNAEALNATGEIKDLLSNKAKKIYREAIISESLSLFQDAKEKFQEVQQVSPVDSDYYRKATEKLKDYLE